MHRCLELAALGRGRVAPNPMVGAVLVYEGRIIGEGYHREYGGPHAEVNCIDSVTDEDRSLISRSVLYVSLEPCAHFGKTPPCADLIIRMNIPKVVIGCRDPFFQVDGKGIEKLKAAGKEITVGVLEQECIAINKRFFTFHTQHRPYIILKWAQSTDGKIAGSNGAAVDHKNRLHISNEYSNRIVHKWRGEEMGIMIGTRTAFLDDPSLNTRLWPGKDPVRLVIDMDLELPGSLKIFQTPPPTIVFNLKKHTVPEKSELSGQLQGGLLYYQVAEDTDLVHQVVNALYQMNIQSVLVEGGALLLQSFIDAEVWDEARVITNEQLIVGSGLNAPVLKSHDMQKQERVFTDVIRYFRNSKIK
jgi:diaminohydroxyphosphoribosylaminopyrimidine deaminase/5-amino-6-(5-phosphoribosylamino)uracil reductase